MDIKIKKWGNSLGLRIPHKLATSFGLDETSVVEMLEGEEEYPCLAHLKPLLEP